LAFRQARRAGRRVKDQRRQDRGEDRRSRSSLRLCRGRRLAPPPAARHVQRDRLVDPLAGPGQTLVVVVSASAGYGKPVCFDSGRTRTPAPSCGCAVTPATPTRCCSCGEWPLRWTRQTPLNDAVTLALAGRLDSAHEAAGLLPQVRGAVQEPLVLVLADVHHLTHTPPQTTWPTFTWPCRRAQRLRCRVDRAPRCRWDGNGWRARCTRSSLRTLRCLAVRCGHCCARVACRSTTRDLTSSVRPPRDGPPAFG